jgi:hypothetical protein
VIRAEELLNISASEQELPLEISGAVVEFEHRNVWDEMLCPTFPVTHE